MTENFSDFLERFNQINECEDKEARRLKFVYLWNEMQIFVNAKHSAMVGLNQQVTQKEELIKKLYNDIDELRHPENFNSGKHIETTVNDLDKWLNHANRFVDQLKFRRNSLKNHIKRLKNKEKREK